MSEIEQKRLYEHFKKLSVEGKDSKQRTECGKYAAEILKSFPQFEKKVVEKKPDKETKSNKEK